MLAIQAKRGRPSDPVLRQALGFMGIRDVDVVRAGGSLAVNLGKARLARHSGKACQALILPCKQ